MYSIRLDGDTNRLIRRLKDISNLDKQGLSESIGEALRESTLERFRQSRSPAGERWPDSARAKAEGGKTLVETARLRNSIRSKADKTGFALGTNVIYASTHQLGAKGRTIRAKNGPLLKFKVGGKWVSTKKVKVTIPARPFLGLSEDDQTEINRMLEEVLGS